MLPFGFHEKCLKPLHPLLRTIYNEWYMIVVSLQALDLADLFRRSAGRTYGINQWVGPEWLCCVPPYASVKSNHGPRTILSPVRFLARRTEWIARRNFTSVLFSWSHQAVGPVQLHTSAYLWFGWIIRKTPWVPRAMPASASYGPRTWILNVFHILRDPYGARAWTERVPYGYLTGTYRNWHNHNWPKSHKDVVFGHTGLVLGPYGPLTVPARAPYGPRTGCSRAVCNL